MTTSTTNTNGQASYTFTPILPLPPSSFLQTTVTAGVGTSTVQFIETTVVPSQTTGAAPIQISLISPLPAEALTGTAGQTGATPLQAQVTITQEGLVEGLGGIAVQLITGGVRQPVVW